MWLFILTVHIVGGMVVVLGGYLVSWLYGARSSLFMWLVIGGIMGGILGVWAILERRA